MPLWKRLALKYGLITDPDAPTWIPVWIHAGMGAIFVAVALLIGIPAMWAVPANAAWWVAREFYQAHKMSKSIDPTDWSRRKMAEWIAPSVAGVIVAGLWLLFFG